MEPLFFEPDFKERVWGGQKLKDVLNKEIPFEHTGESWEIASHNNGQSKIRFGQYAGKTLTQVLIENGEDILGYTFTERDKFPLLIKFIDAKDKLSVQVHPSDDYAKEYEHGELGKSEAWYVLQADPGAKLVAGLKAGTSKEEFKAKIEEDALIDVLNQVEVKAGDVLNIPAGLIHAIGEGILLAEVQQNSDTTYRVYDWGRLGLDGKPRELHVEKSLAVSDFGGVHSTDLVNGQVRDEGGAEVTEYVRCPYFVLEEVDISKEYISEGFREGTFEIYMCVEGQGTLMADNKEYPVKLGDSLMIPTVLTSYSFQTKNESFKMVKAYLPKEV